MFGIIEKTDFIILDFIQKYIRCGFLDIFMPAATYLGNIGIIWIIITVTMISAKKYRQCGIILAIALITGLITVNGVIKQIVMRPRPFQMVSGINLLVSPPGDSSFPSGHTLASFICATVIYLNHRKISYAVIPIAILISFSRLYLYLHFPSDVIAGMIFGIIIGYAVNRICHAKLSKINRQV